MADGLDFDVKTYPIDLDFKANLFTNIILLIVLKLLTMATTSINLIKKY
jgi:hypothetical protein